MLHATIRIMIHASFYIPANKVTSIWKEFDEPFVPIRPWILIVIIYCHQSPLCWTNKTLFKLSTLIIPYKKVMPSHLRLLCSSSRKPAFPNDRPNLRHSFITARSLWKLLDSRCNGSESERCPASPTRA